MVLSLIKGKSTEGRSTLFSLAPFTSSMGKKKEKGLLLKHVKHVKCLEFLKNFS